MNIFSIYIMAAVDPLVWYKFNPANPTLNSGTLGSSNNLSGITVVANTDIIGQSGCLQSGCSVPLTFAIPGTSPYDQQFAISFWFKFNSTTPVSNVILLSYTRAGAGKSLYTSGTGLQYTERGSVPTPATLWNQQWHYFHVKVSGLSLETTVDDTGGSMGMDNVASNHWNGQTLTGFNLGSINGSFADFRVYGNYNNATYPYPAINYMYKIGKNTGLSGLSSSVPAYALINANASYSQLLTAGFTATSLQGSPNNLTVSQLFAIGATFPQLVSGGITIPTLLASPNNYTMSQLYSGGITIDQFIAVPYTVLQLIAGGISIDNLLTKYSYTLLIDNHSVRKTQFDSAGKTIQNLIAGSVAIPKLVTAGYTIQQIVAVPYTFNQLLDGGITLSQFTGASPPYNYYQLVSGNVLISRLRTASVTFSQLIAGGVTSTQFTAQSYSIANLVDGGATNRELLAAGYSLVELQSFGILPAWSVDASANHIIKSYVKDFVDVSGSIVLRENANLYISGNTETAGNISLNRLFVTADASFNRRIFVGGDVSMNGKVAMRGDLSMNGTVTKCAFNNSSIPKSAFASTVPDGADYNTPKIVYDQTFQANDDVSMNGATVSANNVKVSGNIVFGDGTVMNTYNNNILSTNPTVFNSSTFTSLDICGNLVAGSYATSSDYRIKTNIVELDETYTVDKLRPVKYYQTHINREKYGLIAHELQEHYPDLVIGEKDGSELQRVNYTGLIAILINDIKRMKQNLAELESGI